MPTSQAEELGVDTRERWADPAYPQELANDGIGAEGLIATPLEQRKIGCEHGSASRATWAV
jgi:hypothetical protein